MTPQEYQPLNRLYDDLSVLCARFVRRQGVPAAQPADYLLNKNAAYVLDSIRERLLTYVETTAPFFSEREPYRDRLGVLDDADERAKFTQQLVNDLRQLSDNTMNRLSTAPGSTARLSPLFAGTIRRERRDIHDIANRLSTIAMREYAAALPVKAVPPAFGGLKPA